MRDQPQISEHEEMEDAKTERIRDLEAIVKEAKFKLRNILTWQEPGTKTHYRIEGTIKLLEDA